MLDEVDVTPIQLGVNITDTLSIGCMIIPFGIIMDLRNRILINNKKALFLTRVIIGIAILPCFGYSVGIPSSISSSGKDLLLLISYIFGGMIGICANAIDLVSSIYLLLYYRKYYFNSNSVMKYLRFQMIYRSESMHAFHGKIRSMKTLRVFS